MVFMRAQPLGGSWVVLLVIAAGVAGCASEEIPTYGDPARVAGGAGGAAGGGSSAGGNTGTGGACEVDDACAVSFKDDLFPVLDGTAKCADAGCHVTGIGDLTLEAGNAANYYTQLTKYKLGADPYIVPCHPEQSKFPCNLKVADGMNPQDACGNTMPVATANAPTLAQLKQIEDWITCGAPDN